MRTRVVIIALGIAIVMSCAGGSTARDAAPTLSPAVAAQLPRPIVQPITRTSPGAQVAWLRTQTGLIGVDPSGTTVATVPMEGTVAKSPDGATIVIASSTGVTVRSAADGKLVRTLPAPGRVVGAPAFAPDGRWGAFLTFDGAALALRVLDLTSGAIATTAVPHDPKAALPGLSGNTSGAVWATLVAGTGATARRIYAISDWGGPARVSEISVSDDGTAVALLRTSAPLEGCAGPALTGKVVARGATLALFCSVDGAVTLIDLNTLASRAVRPVNRNPFWLAPIFTPDGQLLYLHQWPGFGDEMQVVDLATAQLFGPKPTPTKPGDKAPFAFVQAAYAGGTASTMPVSPDGTKLYSATSDGIVVLRIPELTPLATHAVGQVDEVWVSGDGRTLYGSSSGKVIIVSEDGVTTRTVPLPGASFGFIASGG